MNGDDAVSDPEDPFAYMSDDDMDATPSASLSDRVNGGDTLSDTEDPLICICK